MTTRGERRENVYTTRGEHPRRGPATSPSRLHYRSVRALLPPPPAENLKEEVDALRESLLSIATEMEQIINEVGAKIDSQGRVEELSPLLRKWMDERYTLAP